MSVKPMLIAGGGIAGLAAALGLAKVGQPSIVLEQAPTFEAAGAGVQLGPNAVKALKWLGAWEAVEAEAFAPDAIHVRDGPTGRRLQTLALGAAFARRFGEPYRVIHRADLLSGLVACAHEKNLIELRSGCTVISARQDESGVELDIAPNRTLQGAALIGADGIGSLIRTLVATGDAVHLSHHTIYRALFPAGAAPSGLSVGSVNLWLCPGGHVVHYPVSGGRSLNTVAVAQDAGRAPRRGEPAVPAEVGARFDPCAPALKDFLAVPVEWSRWPAADCIRLKHWSSDRIVLIGDAAHAALPYLAQGAAMALEDAVVLALSLADGRGPEAAFARFAGLRQARTARVQRAARRLGTIYHASGPLRLARNAAMQALPPTGFLRRLAWLYGYDPAQRDSQARLA